MLGGKGDDGPHYSWKADFGGEESRKIILLWSNMKMRDTFGFDGRLVIELLEPLLAL